MGDKENQKDTRVSKTHEQVHSFDSFVLEKSIFSNTFEKDIRRVYIYKKAERLAKAIHLVTPAFLHAPALRDRIDQIAVGLIDAAILPPSEARLGLSRELLALSSMLSIARSGGLLSAMNTDLITREAHTLLQEVAAYEEPRLFLEDAPTLTELYRATKIPDGGDARAGVRGVQGIKDNKGQASGARPATKGGRREAVLAVLKEKGPSYIKDLSTVIREVSEKTIQRELQALVAEGLVSRTGERRWTTYTLAKS